MMACAGKVLIIVENLPVPFDTRVWQEAVTLNDNGYLVSVICPKGKSFTKDYEKINGVNIYRYELKVEGNGALGYLKEYYISYREQLKLTKKVYKEVGFDVIQGCNPPDNIYLIWKKFKKYGVKYVFDHHDLCPELFEAKFNRKGFLYKMLCYFEYLTYKNCSIAFVTNESYKKVAITRCKMDEKKVYVLRSGPNLKRLKLQAAKQKIKKGKKYMVGYLGVIGKQEGIEYLLKAAKYLKEEKGRSDIFYGIVGGGPHLEYLQKLCKKMELDKDIEFTGRVPDQIMLDYLNTADICVNPDTYNEMNDKSTMNKILEYMALGKPIVQFNLSEGKYSAKEASLYAENNNYKDMADKIEFLLDNPEVRNKMGKYGRNRIEFELSWEHTSKALLNGYGKLLSQ
jgi:glycosyltransferase involved in cell wall biosynthesis